MFRLHSHCFSEYAGKSLWLPSCGGSRVSERGCCFICSFFGALGQRVPASPAGSTGSRTSAEVASPLLIPRIVPVVGVLWQEPRGRERVLSRIHPLWPLGPQTADYDRHLSPSSHAPELIDTHLDSTTSLITCPIYVTAFGSFPRRYCFCFMSMCCSCCV